MERPEREVALYIHIPFCRARCSYCDFNTYAGLEHLIPAYVEALSAEIRAAPPVRPRTLYFGGGTPSVLTLDQLTRLFQALRSSFPIPEDIEATLEANPGTVTLSYLQGLRELGVNRLSLGVQSAHRDELRLLGRTYIWEEAVEAMRDARAAGLDNVSLDFIYGIPGQSLARWRETLEAALTLEPEHLSLYALSVEAGTPLEAWIAGGELPAPDEDLMAEMYELAEEMLADAGYLHYELSNWAKLPPRPEGGESEPGMLSPFVCRHNLIYWRNESYLGLGAGAASWWGGKRWVNISHPAAYIARLKSGHSPAGEAEVIPPRLEMGEMMMMGLRLMEGVSDARFRARFGVGLEETFGQELARLRQLGLVEWDGQVVRLTSRGRLLGNQVFQQFLPEALDGCD